MFKVIVAGCRDFSDYEGLEKYLDYVFKDIDKSELEIVCGCARGADKLGSKYAENRGIKVSMFPADWDNYGKSAGYRRNAEMANYSDALVAFWDGKSKGTKHMIDLAKTKKLKIRIKYFK